MARKGSAVGGLALVILVILGAIAKYAKELLIIGGVAVGVWIIYKLFVAKKAEAPPPPQVNENAVIPPPPLRRAMTVAPALPSAGMRRQR